MTKIALLLFVFAGVFAFLAIAELYRTKRTQHLIESELADRAEYLEGTKQRLDAYQQDLINQEARLNMDAATPVRATYFVSESDQLKYTDEKKLIKAVKKSLCTSIVDSMMKITEPHKCTADGREFYIIKFRVKEEA